MPVLTLPLLLKEAALFARRESNHAEPRLYGVTDGKAIGTHIEHKFRETLAQKYTFDAGNTAKGIDFPALNLDIKTTSITQPQSSCPFKSARQKIFGLGYDLLVFVYEKTDDAAARTGRLNILHAIHTEAVRTGDFQTTYGLRGILERHGNRDDLVAFMHERNLPLDDIEAAQIAEELLRQPPVQGYLTISNALQWRLQYTRIIEVAGTVPGIARIY